MIEELNPTTRTFPRTLTEAFQDSGDWFEPPENKLSTWDVCLIMISVCLWFAVVYYWSKA